jgi:hypothetical protein
VSDAPHPPSVYKARLTGIPGLSHITVEDVGGTEIQIVPMVVVVVVMIVVVPVA